MGDLKLCYEYCNGQSALLNKFQLVNTEVTHLMLIADIHNQHIKSNGNKVEIDHINHPIMHCMRDTKKLNQVEPDVM